MNLKQLINKSVYGTVGYIASLEDLETLERYILYNLPVLKQYKQVIAATNYKNYPEFVQENANLWKKYFPDCILLDSEVNRGHSFGTADLDDLIFDYCKANGITWLCKSANDIIIEQQILDKEVEEAEFYYLHGVGYAGLVIYGFDYEKLMDEDFYPQTNFYFIDVTKCDYLNDKEHINEVYKHVQTIPNYNNRAWEHGFRSCESLLRDCINRNNLSKYHLVSREKYSILLNVIKDYNFHDSSHKNIMIDGICHYQYINEPIISI